MISGLRQLNSAWVELPKFKTDKKQTVGECPSLNTHLTWGAVVDLSNFFFHLGLHPSAGRRIWIKTKMGDFQCTAMPFGLHFSPYWTGRLAQIVEKTLRRQGVHLIWYVDDILILGDSQKSVSTNFEILLPTCKEAEVKKVPINSESTGGLPLPTNRSEGPVGGPTAE